MSIRGLLVDLDGTLVDTRAAAFAAYAEALHGFGVSVDRTWWDKEAFGRHWRDFLPEVLAGRTEVDPQEVARRKAEIYPRHLKQSSLNHALVALIATLKPAVRVALVTTASRANVLAVLDHHGVGGLFDEIVTGDDVNRHKPSPDAYQVAAERLKLSADDCLAVEDSATGLAAAQAFGCRCMVVRHDGSAA